MASGGGYRIPPIFSETKPYSRWIEELKVWQSLTELTKKRQGPAIALSLPENEGCIRDKVFSELGAEQLGRDDGVSLLLEFLDKIYKKDELSEAYESYTAFDRFRRDGKSSMENYVSEFEKLYNRTQKFKMTLPESVLAFKLLEGACLSHKERQIVLTGVNYSEADSLFKQMSMSLKKFFGQQSFPNDKTETVDTSKIKVEPALISDTRREVFASRGWNDRRYRGNGNMRYNRGRSSYGSYRTQQRPNRQRNPSDAQGQTLRCVICESLFHFAKDCPHSYENSEKKVFELSHSDNNEEAVLFTGSKSKEIEVLMSEAINCGVLDSACSATVAGECWMDCYLGTLSQEQYDSVLFVDSDTLFKFGGGTILKSKGKATFPCEIAGTKCRLTCDIVTSDIPLLLGKSAMKDARVVLDLKNDRASIFDKDVKLNCTSSGHYCVPLLPTSMPDETFEVLFSMNGQSHSEKYKTILKLHKQFAHPSIKRLKSLLQDAGAVDEDTTKIIEDISGKCEVCQRFKKTPPRPVVSLPLATKFNDVVAMDLKEWQPGIYFLHLIDIATRFSLAAVIKRKLPSVIIDKVMSLWIGSGMGPPKRFITDNGGEFANEFFKDMAENLNIEVWNTAALSPWQNGLCERNHAVVDDNVSKILSDNPDLNLEIALIWAVNAKNSLQMVSGFSPYQLVFGCNPNLPSVLIDRPPALEGVTTSELFASHLNALHSARKAFIEAESSERIRRALRHQIRPTGDSFQVGDRVYFKRDTSPKWKGPGKVLGQDGKVVFVRHGSAYLRIPSYRVIKVGNEFCSLENANDPTDLCQNKNCDVGKESDVISTDFEDFSDTVNVDSEINVLENLEASNGESIPKVNDQIKYLPAGESTWLEAEIVSRGGKATGRYRNWLNVKNLSSGETSSVNFDECEWEKLSENIYDQNSESVNVVVPLSRHNEHEIKAAKCAELENWKKFDCYNEVRDEGQPNLSTRWVITEKPDENGGNSKVKARLVARGFEEDEKVRSDSPTATKETLRIFLSVASSKSWKCRTIDIKAAFLQGKAIEREVFLRPPAEIIDNENILWRLNKCVYGLNDASRNWYFRVKELLLNLKCKQSEIDLGLFMMHSDANKLEGLVMMHVDDFIWAGSDKFEIEVIVKLKDTFHVGKQACGIFKYIGLEINQTDTDIILDQISYIDSISPIRISKERENNKYEPLNKHETRQLRGAIGQINWITNQTRPDASYDSLELCMSIKNPKVENITYANKLLRKLQLDTSTICFPKLNLSSVKLGLYCDASYANLSDGVSSAEGFIIFLIDDKGMCSPLAWKSNKIHRVVKSTLAAETLAMVDGLDTVFYLSVILSEILFNKKSNLVSIECFTDNMSLFENIHSTKSVNEKRLRVDIASIRQMLQNGEISKITWVDNCHQLSDCLTKRGASNKNLLQVLNQGCIS